MTTDSKQTTETCAWRHDGDGTWEASCGEAWTFIDGGPHENSVRFCQGCGRPVRVTDDDEWRKLSDAC